MDEIKVSIIVPVYKVEDYLERCVRSIIKQTHNNIEIILVNDGSPDNCPGICDAYAREDERVRVIHKSNGGLSSARNAGLDIATGDYILFVDSDDWVAPDLAELLLGIAMKYGADISECSYINIYKDCVKLETNCSGEIIEADPLVALAGMLDWRYFLPTACNKLYHRRIFDDIRFPAGKLHEDEFTTYKCYLAASKIVYVDLYKYYYDRSRADSITGAGFNPDSLCVCDAFEERMNYFREHGFYSLEQKMNDNYSYVFFSRIYDCYRHNLEEKYYEEILSNGLINITQMSAENRPLNSVYFAAAEELKKGREAFMVFWENEFLKEELCQK